MVSVCACVSSLTVCTHIYNITCVQKQKTNSIATCPPSTLMQQQTQAVPTLQKPVCCSTSRSITGALTTRCSLVPAIQSLRGRHPSWSIFHPAVPHLSFMVKKKPPVYRPKSPISLVVSKCGVRMCSEEMLLHTD